MSDTTIWSLIFEPITTAINGLRDELKVSNDELRQIRIVLEKIEASLPPLPAIRFIFSGQVEGQEKQENIMSLVMTDIQKSTLSIAPVDSKGNPAQVEAGSVAWSAADA